MLGAIIGDIAGSMHEGAAPRGRHFILFTPRSCFTDDTVLTLAVAHALRTSGDYATCLRQFARRYPSAGYGSAFWQWARADQAGPYGSYGNGSAMRVAPVAWAIDDLEGVIAEAERSAAVTHDHPEGIRGACAIAAAIYLARTGAGKEAIAELVTERFGYTCRMTLAELEAHGGFDVSCQHTVPAAVAAFLLSQDFEDAVRIAVSLGGDTDTLACIAGAIAEAHYASIPDAMLTGALRRLDAGQRHEAWAFAERFQLLHLASAYPSLHRPTSARGLPSGVLADGVSVILRIEAIHRRLPGGWRAFTRMVPAGATPCADMELVCVGFKDLGAARTFAEQMEKLLLRPFSETAAADIAVLPAQASAPVPCDWLELHEVRLSVTGPRVRAAGLKGSRITRIALPEQ